MVTHLVQEYRAPVTLLDLNKAGKPETPLVDLGQVSALSLVDRIWLDGHYKPMKRDGDPGVGRYRISPAVLNADVVISVPKMKVHCSGGITLSLRRPHMQFRNELRALFLELLDQICGKQIVVTISRFRSWFFFFQLVLTRT